MECVICPDCGAPVAHHQEVCSFCGFEVDLDKHQRRIQKVFAYLGLGARIVGLFLLLFVWWLVDQPRQRRPNAQLTASASPGPNTNYQEPLKDGNYRRAAVALHNRLSTQESMSSEEVVFALNVYLRANFARSPEGYGARRMGDSCRRHLKRVYQLQPNHPDVIAVYALELNLSGTNTQDARTALILAANEKKLSPIGKWAVDRAIEASRTRRKSDPRKGLPEFTP
jgi:hypothetical protein